MKPAPPKHWTSDALLDLGRSYQSAAIYAAAADLDVFDTLARGAVTAADLAGDLQCDLRGMTILLDAMVALGLAKKRGDAYSLPAGLSAYATSGGSKSVLSMARHQANCLRNWAQLAWVVKTGRPAPRIPSVRGEAGDREAFIGGMHNLCAPIADQVIKALAPLQFTHLLDLGGASGTWTIAFLHACPSARATLFDLPPVIPLAKQRLASAGYAKRVRLVAGDFQRDPLPPGADLAWVSAIVHQNSRAQNRRLFTKVYRALVPGGRLAIRDVLVDRTRTRPAAGALFAVNMLVATEGGGTFTFEELREDLASAGFKKAAVAREDEAMNAVVVATKGGLMD
jgi:SAM-dependent methyltransferase